MSKIFKASRISIDEYNKVLIKADKIIPKNREEKVADDVEQEVDIESILEKSKTEANKIVETANNERESIINKANEEKEEIIAKAEKEGYDTGYKKGYDEGVVAGAGTYNDLNSEVEEKIKDYNTKRENLFIEAEEEVVEVIVDVIENLTLSLFELNPDLVRILVKKGLMSATIQNKVSIKVSDEDYNYVLENKDELRKYLDSSKEIEILKDFSLMKNDCMLETEFGNINCGLDQQLSSVKESIYSIFKNR